jgi:hypothetical protein
MNGRTEQIGGCKRTGGNDIMKRIAIGIDQPPGRLVDERIVIRRASRND